jgi:iron complex transport system ATP-binding protein
MTRLVAENVSLPLNGRRVLERVSLAVEGGTLTGLVGPNGAGKTTLMRVLAGLLRPDEGTVTLDGKALAQLNRSALARHIAYMPQDAVLAWPVPVRDVVMLGRLPFRRPFAALTAADRQAIERALTAADVTSLALRRVTTLSAGERTRVLFARALASETPVLLADEPVAALDPYHQLQTMELLRAAAARRVAVLAVLHDLSLAARFCDRLVLLADGAVRAEGAAESVARDPALAKAFAVEALVGAHEGKPYVLPWRRRAGEA